MASYELVGGDTGSALKITIDDSETPTPTWDLTGATVRLFWKVGRGALQGPVVMTITDAANRKVEHQFAAAELPVTGGILEADVEITDSLGKVLTNLEKIKVPVRARLA